MKSDHQNQIETKILNLFRNRLCCLSFPEKLNGKIHSNFVHKEVYEKYFVKSTHHRKSWFQFHIIFVNLQRCPFHGKFCVYQPANVSLNNFKSILSMCKH